MSRYRYILFLLFLWSGLWSGGQQMDPRCHRSTEGTEFWFGFMEGRNTYEHYVEITVSTREGATFSISIGQSGTPVYTNTIGPNSSDQIRLPYKDVEPALSEQVLNMGLHLVSDKPVNVYCLNRDRNSSDVAVMYPVESLGTEYFTMCYTPHIDRNNYNHGRNSEFVIVAPSDNTLVTITPVAEPDGPGQKGVPFAVNLNRGQLYQVQSYEGDFTGSYITSDKPVAVYSGSLSTTIPFEATGGWDHMYEQMPPVNTWGREYYTVPLSGRKRDFFRVLASQDNTVYYIGNVEQPPLRKGEFAEFELSTPVRIFAEKPVLVAQFSQSKNNDNVANGDGFMVLLSPVSQAKNDVTFVAYDSPIVKIYFVNVVVPLSETGNIELNGNRLSPGIFTAYPGAKYAYAQIELGSGPQRLRNAVNPDRGFIAYVYGYGPYEAYGYGVGFNLDLVLDIGKSIDFEGDTLALCNGSSINIDAGPYFDFYRWDTGDTTREIEATKRGQYALTASTVDGCIQRDSIYVYVSDPWVKLGNDTLGCPHTKPLVASSNARVVAKYEWSTGESSREIKVSEPGEYQVALTDKYGCVARDTLDLIFHPVPTVKLDGETHVCGDLTGILEAEVSEGEAGWSMKSFSWVSDPSPGTLFTGATDSSAHYSIPQWGDYRFIYSLTTTHQCVVSDTLAAGIFAIPTSDFMFTDNPADPCAGYSREVLYTGSNATPAATMDWDFGGCDFQQIAWNRVRVSFAPFGTKQPFVSLQVSENGCTGDVFQRAFGASPDFTMTTSASQACDSDFIVFTGKLNVQDILDCEWDFGDGSRSTEQFPVHAYTNPGFYDVSLQITNPVTGCQAGFRMEDMVKIFRTPVARFSVDYPVALLGQATLSFDNLTEYGETYSWDFGDGHTSAEMHPSHTYDQVGKFPVQLIAHSGVGCMDTLVSDVDILPFNLHAPNAFRPGSSIDENRTFIPFTLGVDPTFFHLQIFNRWGEMIFESKRIDHPWDGKMKNGNEAPMGNYIWKALYTDVQGFHHSRTGQVVLVR